MTVTSISPNFQIHTETDGTLSLLIETDGSSRPITLTIEQAKELMILLGHRVFMDLSKDLDTPSKIA